MPSSPPFAPRPVAPGWSLLLLLAGAGCAVGPNYSRPTASAPQRWELAEPWREAAPKDAVPKTAWWTLFRDEDLAALEADLLAANKTFKVSVAHLDQARAAAAVQNAQLFPTIGVAPLAGGERYSGNRPTGSTAAFTPVTQANYLLPFTLSYEIDLFGAVRRGIEAAQASYQASAADLENVRLVLTAELAADYFTLRQLDTQIAFLNRNVENLQKGLDVMNARHRGGIASSLDVAQEETLLESTRTQATLLRLQRKQFEDAIAVLVGKPAPDVHLAPRELVAEPPPIDVALPTDILERRPDVAEAERQMAVANAQIGVATAAYYPSLALTAQAGWNSQALSQLLNAASSFWSVALGLAETIFTGGARTAQVSYAKAGYEAAVASYRATVLNAFREVQDSLTGLEVLDQARRSQAEAVRASQRQLELANSRYVGGLVSYLDVVIAQQTLLNNEQEAAIIQGQRLVTSVLLVKALGGGWDAQSLAAVKVEASFANVAAP